MRFFRPSVPILSQKFCSLSSFFVETGIRGDLGRGDAIIEVLFVVPRSRVSRESRDSGYNSYVRRYRAVHNKPVLC